MPDLKVLLTAEAIRQQPITAPTFDELAVRAHRRRTHRVMAVASTALVVVLVVALGGWLLSPQSPSRGQSARPDPKPAVNQATFVALQALALQLAASSHDPHPTRIEAVKVRTVPRPSDGRTAFFSGAPEPSGYLIELQGDFTCAYCKVVGDLHGTVQTMTVSDPGLKPTNHNFGGRWVDLSVYGTPFSLLASPATEPAQPTATKTLPVSPEVYARLRQTAIAMAAGDGDPHPTRMEAAVVTDVNAADSGMSHDIINGVRGAGYVVEIQGRFVCGGCSRPAGAKAPQGTVAYAIVRAGSFDSEGGGLDTTWVDLSTIGRAFNLASPTTVAPVTTTVPVVPVQSAPIPTESAAPTAPDPRSLTEAKQRATAAAIQPAKATIEVAATVTAGQLRIAGLTIPSAVGAGTTMYVVVVNGEPIFPSAVGTDGKRATEFAVVFSTDGTGRGDQVVYYGAFGLPIDQNAAPPEPTVVDSSQLATGSSFSYEPASTLVHSSFTTESTLRSTGMKGWIAKPIAALVYANTLHVTHRLAWLIQYDLVPVSAGGPVGGHVKTYLETSQVLIDANTGKQLAGATF